MFRQLRSKTKLFCLRIAECTLWIRFFSFFFTLGLGTGPRRSLSLELSDTRVYEPHIRARFADGRAVFLGDLVTLHLPLDRLLLRWHVQLEGVIPHTFIMSNLKLKLQSETRNASYGLQLLRSHLQLEGVIPHTFIVSTGFSVIFARQRLSTQEHHNLHTLPSIWRGKLHTLNTKSHTLNPKPHPNPKSSTLNPEP